MNLADENEDAPPLTLRTLASQLRYARGSNQAKAAAKDFIRKPITNRETGFGAEVSGESLKKMLSETAVIKSASQQAHHQAVANADKLFELATLGLTRDPERKDDIGKITQFHHFDAPMPFDGRVLWVKILVKEVTDRRFPNRLYTLSAVEIDKKPSAVDNSVSGGPNSKGVRLPTGRPEGFGRTFAAMITEVKQGMSGR